MIINGIEAIELAIFDFDIATGITTWKDAESCEYLRMSYEFYNNMVEIGKGRNSFARDRVFEDNCYCEETPKTLTVSKYLFDYTLRDRNKHEMFYI